MSRLQALKIVALAGVCTLTFGAAAQAQDNFDVSAAPAASTPAPAASKSLGEVSMGIQGVTQSSPYFGRYNGMPDSGVGFVGSWNLGTRDNWDSGSTRFYSFTGDDINVGFGEGFAPEGAINFKFGDQGTWSAFAAYDSITYRASNDYTSLLNSSGQLSPGYWSALTALGASGPLIGQGVSTVTSSYFGSVGSAKYYPVPKGSSFAVQTGSVGSTVGHSFGTVAPAYPASPANIAPYDGATSPSNYDIYLGSLNELVNVVGTQRQKGEVGGKYDLGDWTLGAVISHEHKDGSLENSMTTGGSNSGFVTFVQPVNYDQDTYTATAAYDTDLVQAHLAYEFSNFIDHNNGYAFQGWNFTEVKTGSTYSSYESNGVYSTPPSNQAHTFSGEFAVNVAPATRINATAVYSLQLQNQALVSPTENAFALQNFAYYFNQDPHSLQGVVNTWFVNVTANSRLTDDLSVKLAYSLDARDPTTGTKVIFGDKYDAVTPDTITYTNTSSAYACAAAPAVSCAQPIGRIAAPESWTKQKINLEASYRIDPTTKASIGYKFESDDRTNAISHETTDNGGYLKLQSSIIPDVQASLGYSYSDRTASAPDFSLWESQIMADCISNTNGIYQAGTLGCQQVPTYEAARTQNAANLNLSSMLSEKASASLFVKWTDNRYHDPNAIYNTTGTNPIPLDVLPSVGVNHDYSVQFGPDINYRASSRAEFHLFYTFLREYRAMRALNAATNTAGKISVLNDFEYSENTTYDIHTVGLGGTFHCTDDIKLVADYIFTHGNLAFAQAGSWTLGQGSDLVGGDPNMNDHSTDHQVKLHTVYDYSPSTQVFVGYQFDSVAMEDWALVGKSIGQVLTGNISPKYNVSTITAGLTLKI